MRDHIPTTDDSPLSARFYVSDCVHLLKKHWLVLFLVPALLITGVVFYHLKGTRYYSAAASVYMDPSFGRRIQTESSSGKATTLLDDEEALFSMEESICSDAMTLRVLKKLNLIDDSDFLPDSIQKRVKQRKNVSEARIIHSVKKRYSAELVNATRILKVHVEDTDPDRAVKIAQTYISEFVLFLQEQRVESEIDLKENLLLQAEVVKGRATDAEKELNRFRKGQSDFLVEQDSDLFSQKMMQTSAELNRTNADLIKLSTLLRGLEQIDAQKNPVRIINLAKGEYAVDFEQVLSQRSAAMLKLEDIKQRYGPSHSDYRAAYNQFISINKAIHNHAQEIKNSTVTRFALLTEQKETLEMQMASLRNQFTSYKTAGAEFRGLTGTAEREWALYAKLNERILNLTDQAELSPNLATPLGDPIIPFNPTKKYLVSAVAAGIVLSAGWVAVIGAILILRGLPFTCTRQIQDLLGVPFAGTIDRKNLSNKGVLSSLPLLTGSSKVLHLTTADERASDQNICNMVTDAYRSQNQQVTVVQVSEIPEISQYEFTDAGIDAFEVTPSQIEVRKLRLKIREFLNKDPNRTIVIDSTGVKDAETKLALAGITNATVIVVRENCVTREHTKRWFQRFTQQAGNVVALYQTEDCPIVRQKALTMKSVHSRPEANSLQIKETETASVPISAGKNETL